MYDVIIAGAGPAGSTCARECAREGLAALLLDKAVFPRPKPCGGAVSEYALSLLDFTLPENIIEEECFGAQVHYHGRTIFAEKEQRIAALVSRDRFDSFLAGKAVEGGARFNPGEKVVDIDDTNDTVSVVTAQATYQTRFLIGADGVHSRVARSVRPPFSRNETTLALASRVPADEKTNNPRNGVLDLHFGTAPFGYGWLFPHRKYYSLGIAGITSQFSRPRESLKDLAHSLHVAPAEVQGYFIPFGGIKRTIAKGRILLAGDAAGFADPFHGEGISHAILSGKLAARAIIDAIKNGKGPISAASWYRRETEQRIGKHLRIALRMARLLEKYPRLFLRIFFDHPEALQRYLDIPAGRTDYRRFQRWVLSRIPFLLLPGQGNGLARDEQTP